eukprot:6475462-Amphidinium_carterae.3
MPHLEGGEWLAVESEGSSEEPIPSCALAEWRRLVRAFLRIRRLQRIWSALGNQLQSYNPALRLRLRNLYPYERNHGV